jgi:hypothetical protein
MTRELDMQLTELRRTVEMYKATADRCGRGAESGYLCMALESLERCEGFLVLAMAVSPSGQDCSLVPVGASSSPKRS